MFDVFLGMVIGSKVSFQRPVWVVGKRGVTDSDRAVFVLLKDISIFPLPFFHHKFYQHSVSEVKTTLKQRENIPDRFEV